MFCLCVTNNKEPRGIFYQVYIRWKVTYMNGTSILCYILIGMHLMSIICFSKSIGCIKLISVC